MFRACQICTPNATNALWSQCQCVLADGVERGILTANRMLPGPSIQVCQGDKVVIDVKNHIEGSGVTLHWHGILQKGSQYYDGVPFVTQCPIQQGTTFRYYFFSLDNNSLLFLQTIIIFLQSHFLEYNKRAHYPFLPYFKLSH